MDLIAATAPHTCTRKTSLAGVAVYEGFLSILSFFLSFFLHLFLHLMYPRIKSLDIYTNTVRNTAYHTNRNCTADDVTLPISVFKIYIYIFATVNASHASRTLRGGLAKCGRIHRLERMPLQQRNALPTNPNPEDPGGRVCISHEQPK